MPKPFVITIVGAESSGKTTLAMDLAAHFECPWVQEYAREYLSALGRPYDENDLEIIAKRQLEAILDIVSRVLRPADAKPGATAQQPTSVPFAPNPLMLRRPSSSLSSAQQPGALKENSSNHNLLQGQIKSNASTCFPSSMCDSSATIENRKSKIIFVDGGMMNIHMWAKIKYNKIIPIVEEALRNDVTDLYILCRTHKEWEPDALREAPGILERVWIYNQYLEELVRGKKPVEIMHGKKEKKLKRAIRKINYVLKE